MTLAELSPTASNGITLLNDLLAAFSVGGESDGVLLRGRACLRCPRSFINLVCMHKAIERSNSSTMPFFPGGF